MTDNTSAEAPKPQRSALLVFTQATLMLEGLTALFATIALSGLERADQVSAPQQTIWAGGLSTAACMILATGFMDRRWGIWLGGLLQLPMIAAYPVSPAVTFIGAVFAVVWFTGVWLGAKIDRERAERLDAAGGH